MATASFGMQLFLQSMEKEMRALATKVFEEELARAIERTKARVPGIVAKFAPTIMAMVENYSHGQTVVVRFVQVEEGSDAGPEKP